MNKEYTSSTDPTIIDEKELWNKNGRYKRYWTHHQQVSKWMKKYSTNYKKQSHYHSNQINSYIPYYNNPYHMTNSQRKMQNRHGYQSHDGNYSHWPEGHVINHADDANFDEDELSDDSFEMEISEELRHFFSVSAKFKEERRKARESEALEDESAHSAQQLKRSTAPPSERPGQRRLKEMKDLYGKNAAMIHGMETALQLQFDRACDKKQPSHWPIIPLNV
ncbi:gem-associated protein 8-like isoform X1 [Antedon mediterranea]|uniref:gem-associated protein 8-like isoform X1 n=1 Tax=Antedon mediterranea TaxID=105859 RepID=UPI003AF51222